MIATPAMTGLSGMSGQCGTRLAGCAADWDASVISGMFTDTNRTIRVANDGDFVASISDQSGTGNHAFQFNQAKQPLYKPNVKNGRSVVRFDGSNDILVVIALIAGLQQPTTIFLAGKPLSVASNTALFDGVVSGHRQYLDVDSSGKDSLFSGGGSQIGTFTSLASPHLWDIVYNGANSLISRDNSVDTPLSIGGNDLTGFCFGGSIVSGTFTPFDLYRLLIFSGALSNARRAAIRAMLNSQWAIY